MSRAQNNVQQSDIIRLIFGISEQISIYPEEMSGQKRPRHEDDREGCTSSKKRSITRRTVEK